MGVLSLSVIVLLFSPILAMAKEATWSEWSDWNGECDITIQSASKIAAKSRFRFCVPPNDGSNPICHGRSTDVVSCGDCPSSGSWAEWGVLDGCSAPCGACGRRFRTRECKQTSGCPPVPCEGVGRHVEEDDEPCDTRVICMFPHRPCCDGYRYGVSTGRAICEKHEGAKGEPLNPAAKEGEKE